MKSSPQTKCNVLLIEDSVESVALATAYLNDPSIRLTVAADGNEGIEAFKLGSFDLVLMDIQMPRLDGCEATAAIREWEATEKLCATPIVALTASSSAEALGRIYAAGCTQYLSKPITRTVLLQTVKQFFVLRQAVAVSLSDVSFRISA